MKKKIIKVYLPVLEILAPDGSIVERKLKPRETKEIAEDALDKALMGEVPGSNGWVDEFSVVVEESEILLPPGYGGEGGIILPQ
jgi:hypothetical protein